MIRIASLSCFLSLLVIAALPVLPVVAQSGGTPAIPVQATPAQAQTQAAPATPAAAPSATLQAAPASPQSTAVGGKAVADGTASGTTSSIPTDAKAKKTFEDAKKLLNERSYAFALDNFRKADKQDGGKCIPCEVQAFKAAQLFNDFKAAREEAALLVEHVNGPAAKAQAHYLAGSVCLSQGAYDKNAKAFEAADQEFQAALQLQPDKYDCLYADGMALAHLKQDGVATERFQQFLQVATAKDVNYARAQRFAEHPELARARVAPNFRLTTSDGKTITLESLTGKVVLIDFWATWCGPCREALPHVKQIAKRFEGQPFQVVSISLDHDEAKWRDFIGHNEMTWIQYRDGGFDGSIAKLFAVNAIPATFTIDADGVLQDQHVGDADIEGKLKKLIARANEVNSKKNVAEVR